VTVASNLTITGQLSQTVINLDVLANATLTTHNYFLGGGTLSGPGTVAIVGGLGNPGGMGLMATSMISVSNLTVDAQSNFGIQANTTFDGTNLTLNGSSVWASGKVLLQNGATITNNGTFTAADAGDSLRSVLAGPFTNNGTFIENSSGTSEIRTAFNSPAGSQILVQQGDLELTRTSGTIACQVTVSAGASLSFNETPGLGVQTLAAGAQFLGQGTVVVTLATPIVVAQGVTVNFVTPLQFSGDLTGGGTITSQTSLQWLEGSFGTAGSGVYVDAYGSLIINNPAPDNVTLTDSTLINYGQANWEGTGNINLSNADFINFGQLAILNNAAMNDTGAGGPISLFDNAVSGTAVGTVTKTVAGNGTLFNIAFQNEGNVVINGSTVNFQQGYTQNGANSVTDIEGGQMLLGAQYTLNAGLLEGAGFISGNVMNNGGTVGAFQSQTGLPAIMTISGSYTQGANGTLQINASSGSNWGLLQVLGNANLAGTLTVDLLGTYNPNPGFTDQVFVATGTMAGTMNLTNPWTLITDPNDLTVKV
jgi:hypothetical protein